MPVVTHSASSHGHHGRRAAPLRRKGVFTIPQEVREQLDLHEGDNLLVSVQDGQIVLTPAALIPREQAWFWTEDWQAGEAEVEEQIGRGEGTTHADDESFLSALREEMGQ